MKNSIGEEIALTLFGESHGEAIGCVLDGVPSGFLIDTDQLKKDMELRKSVGSISTPRKEADEVRILSGVKDGYTEGTPIALVIENANTRSSDYEAIRYLARPGHADYTAEMRYDGYQDTRGGGHFSGRLTAPIVAAGSICRQMLAQRGVVIGTHIKQLYDLEDDAFNESKLYEEVKSLNTKTFAVLNEEKGKAMIARIEEARNEKDSLGGILETVILGVEAGIGEPEFGSLESRLSAGMFSVPAVKGIAFGSGYAFAKMKGSEANDAFCMKDGKVCTETNHNGGINGGISNGMPVVFTTVIKPTPSIAQVQKTVNFKTGEDTTIEIQGRHDPAIIHRARVVIDSMCGIILADMYASRYGRDWIHS